MKNNLQEILIAKKAANSAISLVISEKSELVSIKRRINIKKKRKRRICY